MARMKLLQAHSVPLLLKSTIHSLHSRPVWRKPLHAYRAPRAVLRAGTASEAGLSYSVNEDQYNLLLAYLDQVLEFNQHTNLTAIRDRDQAIERHIHDCLALLPVLDQHASKADGRPIRVIDVGSGGGFPGVVLAIARPQYQVRLLDSLRKRCKFVQGAIISLGIPNAQTVWGRAETLGQDARHREAYDVAVARAVADMRVLSELCLPFVRPGGHFVAAKGPKPSAEVAAAIKALNVLGGKLVSVEEVASFSEEGRPQTAVIVKKVGRTPQQYPRHEGTPSKQPL